MQVGREASRQTEKQAGIQFGKQTQMDVYNIDKLSWVELDDFYNLERERERERERDREREREREMRLNRND